MDHEGTTRAANQEAKATQHKARQSKVPLIENDMRRQSIIPSSLLFFTLSALEILFIHVAADSPQSTSWTDEFWQRLRAGPNALLPIDKILFGSLILLAFELLDFLAKHSGRELYRLGVAIGRSDLSILDPN